jgi:hypothetical protein
MLRWLRRRQNARRLAQADAGALIRDHGAEASREARERERDVVLADGTTHAGRTLEHWPRVGLIAARATGNPPFRRMRFSRKTLAPGPVAADTLLAPAKLGRPPDNAPLVGRSSGTARFGPLVERLQLRRLRGPPAQARGASGGVSARLRLKICCGQTSKRRRSLRSECGRCSLRRWLP